MNASDILTLPPSKWYTQFTSQTVTITDNNNYKQRSRTPEDSLKWRKYFEGDHPILKDETRKDIIREGQAPIKRTRLILQYAKQIVDTCSGMMFGESPTLTCDDPSNEQFKRFQNAWAKEAKLDEHTMKLSDTLCVEGRAAEIFVFDGADSSNSLQVHLLSAENGDEFYPFWDESGKMGAFTRKFSKKVIENNDVVDQEVIEIYTGDGKMTSIDGGENYTTEPYPISMKIPVIYYDQKTPEFYDVMSLINKQELVKSQNSDVNRRIGNPAVVITGKINSSPEYNDDVKTYQLTNAIDADGKINSGKVEYLTADSAPEAIKMELQDYKDDMYKLTWLDLSYLYQQAKTGNLSGAAIKLMFAQTNMKIARKHKLVFGSFIRRVNLMKDLLGISEDLNISVLLNSVIPTAIDEEVSAIGESVLNGTLSYERGAELNPYNKGVINPYEDIKKEKAEEPSTAVNQSLINIE